MGNSSSSELTTLFKSYEQLNKNNTPRENILLLEEIIDLAKDVPDEYNIYKYALTDLFELLMKEEKYTKVFCMLNNMKKTVKCGLAEELKIRFYLAPNNSMKNVDNAIKAFKKYSRSYTRHHNHCLAFDNEMLLLLANEIVKRDDIEVINDIYTLLFERGIVLSGDLLEAFIKKTDPLDCYCSVEVNISYLHKLYSNYKE